MTSTSPLSTGPLPKSDSVQSLVSLMSCTPSPPCTTAASSAPATIRGVDVDAHPHAIPVTHDVDTITLSARRLQTLSLGALASPIVSGLRELSLAANALDALDLGPLSWCPSLTVLTLNSNRLSHLDLSPLTACKRLERLWLHDNCLERIDLTPLSACVNLRSLYIEDNSIDHHSVDLTPLKGARGLRSLRLGGNKLAGALNLTALVNCVSLSVFNVDAAVKLSAEVEASRMRVAPALRRIVLDVEFNPPSQVVPSRRAKGVTTPPTSPPSFRRKLSSSSSFSKSVAIPGNSINPTSVERNSISVSTSLPTQQKNNNNNNNISSTSPTSTSISKSSHATNTTHTSATPTHVVKVLLIGFRRLARYAAEDSLSKCGKVVIRASTNSVATSDPSLLLDSHIILLYSPQEKTIRQVQVVAGRMPVVVIGTERYRSSADMKLYDLLQRLKFFIDPIDLGGAKLIYQLGICFATGDHETLSILNSNPSHSLSPITTNNNNKYTTTTSNNNINRNNNHIDPMRKSHSSYTLSSSPSSTTSTTPSPSCSNDEVSGIELEHIEDVDDDNNNNNSNNENGKLQRTKSADDIDTETFGSKSSSLVPSSNSRIFSDVRQRLNEMRSRRPGRSLLSFPGYELSENGRNKLCAERNSIHSAFNEHGGFITSETSTCLARICGLAKCAAPLLFRTALGSAFEVEATTPEAGVPNGAFMERKKRISCEGFLAYWDSRLKLYDGEERLSNVLEDSHFTQLGTTMDPDTVGHSAYGARVQRGKEEEEIPSLCYSPSSSRSISSSSSNRLFLTNGMKGGPGDSTANMSTDMWCPCDAGIEELVRTFMEGRASRFGAYALVKLSEAVAIGASLVIHSLREAVRGRVGGRARAVCPKEVKRAKLNAALVAAEVGIFEGVVRGLSMTQMRTIKGCFATEVSPMTISLNKGCALSWTLSVDEVQHFCVSRKTLLPMVVECVMRVHCGSKEGMSLGEFAVLLQVLGDLGTDGALDYLFSVVDVDQDDQWSVADVRHFHMEKERLWLDDGMAVNELQDIWINLLDMIGQSAWVASGSGDVARRRSIGSGLEDDDVGWRAITRKEVFRLGEKDRKTMIQMLLFVDDDYSSVNIRRTMELSKKATSSVVVM